MIFLPTPGAASCRAPCAFQFRDPLQVVRHYRQVGGDLGSTCSDEARLSHLAHRLQLAEDLFDPLSFALADLIAFVVCSTPVESFCLAPFDTGNLRSDVAPAHVPDKVFQVVVVALVSPQSLCASPAMWGVAEQLVASLKLGQRGIGDVQADAQVAAILHECVVALAELGQLAVVFPRELSCWVDGVLVSSVGVLYASQINYLRTTITPRRFNVFLVLKALEERLGVDHDAIHGKLIKRRQLIVEVQTHHIVEEAQDNVYLH